MIGRKISEGERQRVEITFDAAEAVVAEVATAVIVGEQIASAVKAPLLFSDRGRAVMLCALREFIEKRVEVKL